MKIKKLPTDVWKEYRRGVEFNEETHLYETIKENEAFFVGDQWNGVNAPNLPKPVLNVLQRCVSYYISTIVSDDIGIQLNPFGNDEGKEEMMNVFCRDVDRIMEDDKTKAKFREIIRNAAVDGDGCLYWYWDDSVKTGEKAKGDVRSVVIPNINVIFGNMYECSVQKQPYILVIQRLPLGEVEDEAEKYGMPNDRIVADEDINQGEKGNPDDLVTVITKLWREKGTIHAQRSTMDCIIRPEWDTMCELYPLAWMRWHRMMGSFHGHSAVEGMIPNQITINKLFAMYIRSVEMNAFPKVVYDISKFGQNGWTNRVGEAIGVAGDVSQAAVNVLRGGDVSAQVMEVIQACITLTKDCMGANDAALGNVRVENAAASAIIATQQAAAAPLEIQRQQFFDFVEDCIQIILDFMGNYYGVRTSKFEIKDTTPNLDPMMGTPMLPSKKKYENKKLDYGMIKVLVRNLEISVGSSAYWSEVAQMQTMDNLLQYGVIQDTILYLESIPDKWLPNKQQLIEAAREIRQQQENQQQMQNPMGSNMGNKPISNPLPQGNSNSYFGNSLSR